MESIGKECTELKQKYETCFNKWYAEGFLKGDRTDICAPLFQEYKKCLDRVLKEKKIDVMLEEHRKMSSSQETTPNAK